MVTLLASAAGSALRSFFAGVQRLRHPRPIHSSGVALEGTLRRLPSRRESGLDWFDAAPAGEIVPLTARVSRAVGLPAAIPDVIGLALRLPTSVGEADILFATTGFGIPGRWLLAARRGLGGARFTTYLPYRGRRGPVLIGARAQATAGGPSPSGDLRAAITEATWRLVVYYASPLGRWHAFGVLELRSRSGMLDTRERYDPIRHPLPSADIPAWVHRLREPAYRRVQSSGDGGVSRGPGAR